MKKTTMWIIGLVLAFVVIFAYMAFVGFASAVDDVNTPDDDPTGEGREPVYFGIVNVGITVSSGLFSYYGSVDSVDMNLFDYINPETGQVFTRDTWNVLYLLPGDDDGVITYQEMESWVVVNITGPEGYAFDWVSLHVEYEFTQVGDTERIDFTSGRCFIWDEGTYALTVTAYAKGLAGTCAIDVDRSTFIVS